MGSAYGLDPGGIERNAIAQSFRLVAGPTHSMLLEPRAWLVLDLRALGGVMLSRGGRRTTSRWLIGAGYQRKRTTSC
jgi:hypothetical protein